MNDMDVVALRQLVQRLSLMERRVLVLHYAEELSTSEVALVLDVAEQTVLSILAELSGLARKRLGLHGWNLDSTGGGMNVSPGRISGDHPAAEAADYDSARIGELPARVTPIA